MKKNLQQNSNNKSHSLQAGLDQLMNEKKYQEMLIGNVALLCHNASISRNIEHGSFLLQKLLGKRLTKIFGPQHGFMCDVQDNMIETKHSLHPYLKIPVYSLYSETRIPTDEMLSDIQTLVIDLQEIGCRDYTYLYTMTLCLEKCAEKNIKVVILDRPNPINGVTLEGNILDMNFASFIGRHPIPVRHGMTMGELALMHQKHWTNKKVELDVIPLLNWNRDTYLDEYDYPFVMPSPNIPVVESTVTFPATVLYEGTNLSEGRGTCRPLEGLGHPKIEPYAFIEEILKPRMKKENLEGFVLRPHFFQPTFNKWAQTTIGGIHIHVTDRNQFKPWRVGVILLQEVFHYLKNDFAWKNPPYEYEYHKLPIDMICGTDKIRLMIEKNQSTELLNQMEKELSQFAAQREEFLLY